MLKHDSTAKTKTPLIPKVLLQAKKQAKIQASGKEKPWDKAWEKGPWDKGHWANRK